MRRSRNAPIKKEFAGSEVSGSAIFLLPDSFGVLLQPLGFDKLIFLHPERRAVAAVELVRLVDNFGAHFQKYFQRHIPSVSVHLRSPQSKQCTQNPAQQVGAQMAVPKAWMNGKASYMRSFRFFPGYDSPTILPEISMHHHWGDFSAGMSSMSRGMPCSISKTSDTRVSTRSFSSGRTRRITVSFSRFSIRPPRFFLYKIKSIDPILNPLLSTMIP